ncbi:MAG: hypothetical protein ACRBN8_38910 [Nannocystales bacterium]
MGELAECYVDIEDARMVVQNFAQMSRDLFDELDASAGRLFRKY